MPRIPLAVVSTSSDESVVSDSDPAGAFNDANWDVLHMESFVSMPFSDVSHSPYGMESNFLDSFSRGGSVAHRRSSPAGNAMLDRHDTVVTSARAGSLTPRGPPLRGFRLVGNEASQGQADAQCASNSGIPPAPAHYSPKLTDALTMHQRVAVAQVRSGRKAKPPSQHRSRALQMEVAKWLEDDRSTDVLVQREVSKRAPLSPIVPADGGGSGALSLSSSCSATMLTPPLGELPSPSKVSAALRSAVSAANPPPQEVLPCAAAVPAAAHPRPLDTHAMAAAGKPSTTRLLGDASSGSPLDLAPRMHLAPPRRIAPLGTKKDTTQRATQAPPQLAPLELMPTAAAPRGPTSASPRRLSKPQSDAARERRATVAGVSPSSQPSPTTGLTSARAAHGGDGAPASANGSAAAEAGSTTPSPTNRRRKPRERRAGHRSSGSVEVPADVKADYAAAAATRTATATTTTSAGPSTKPANRARLQPLLLSPDAVAQPKVNGKRPAPLVLKEPHDGPPPEKLLSPNASTRHSSIRSVNVLPPLDYAAGVEEVDAAAAASSPKHTPAVSPANGPLAPVPERLMYRRSSTVPPASSPASPDRGAPPQSRPATRPYGATDAPLASPQSRVAAERLVAFVRAVSDPEVLHVIHDYLEEHQKSVPRYRLASEACRELLQRKEELLAAPVEPKPRRTESGVFAHQMGETQTSPPLREAAALEVTARPGEGLSLAQRLLQQVVAEEKAEGSSEVGADDDVDEFDDFNYYPTPYRSSARFSFGQPTVSGTVTRVFAEGMLYKIKTARGEYYFYNDSLHEVMMVRVQCKMRGNEKINERAMQTDVPETGETEITIAILPEETNFFMSGVTHLPHFMAKRVPVPPDYVSPSVTQSLRKVNAEINAVRKALGKWSRASDQAAYLRCCLKNHLRFTDLNFRPSAESLCRPAFDPVAIPAVTWRRPEEYVYLPDISHIRLFRGEISCFLVRQGELSNHTVVAAMAAVAQRPDHVRWMFRHPVSAHVGRMERAQGCYRVTLLHNGWWHTYLVDDYVPASLKGPLFASCAEDPRRLWVPLLEKAYAKALGSYAATCLVDAMEALGDFTGFPVRFLDSAWAAAAQRPDEAASRNLFRYLERSVRAGCMVLLFTPAPSDKQSSATEALSRKRSSRLLPVKGIVPQFLPGHIYFLRDIAFYQELDLRMVQLKNPWTWETRNKVHYEKQWKYTTWYDQPESSVSLAGSTATTATYPTSSHGRPTPGLEGPQLSPAQVALNERKGTMWAEWREVLAAFAGGGVCYTLWDRRRYRMRNSFVKGRPRFALELRARRRVEVFVTLSLETVSETLDNFGTIVASRPAPLYGTALSVVQRQADQTARVLSESCEDIECVTGRRMFVLARDVSMKLTVDASRGSNGASLLVVPLLNPQAFDEAAPPAATSQSSTAASSRSAAPEVRFVVSVVSDSPAGDDEDFSVNFVSLRRSCGVFSDATTPFPLEGTPRVTTEYQVCTAAGVVTCEGARITGHETKSA